MKGKGKLRRKCRQGTSDKLRKGNERMQKKMWEKEVKKGRLEGRQMKIRQSIDEESYLEGITETSAPRCI